MKPNFRKFHCVFIVIKIFAAFITRKGMVMKKSGNM